MAGLLVELVQRHVLTRPVPTDEEVPFYTDVVRRLRPLVRSALNAAAARSADRVIPQIVSDRLIELVERREKTS